MRNMSAIVHIISLSPFYWRPFFSCLCVYGRWSVFFVRVQAGHGGADSPDRTQFPEGALCPFVSFCANLLMTVFYSFFHVKYSVHFQKDPGHVYRD